MNFIERLRLAREQIDQLLSTLEEQETEKKLSQTKIDIDLTPTEKEIFVLMGQGLKGRDIAKQMGKKVKTIHTHRENIRKKFKVGTSYELMQIAKESLV